MKSGNEIALLIFITNVIFRMIYKYILKDFKYNILLLWTPKLSLSHNLGDSSHTSACIIIKNALWAFSAWLSTDLQRKTERGRTGADSPDGDIRKEKSFNWSADYLQHL